MTPIRIELPTPFPIGTVNSYFLPGHPTTLVDAGPRTPEALAALESGLLANGTALEEIELLLLTHQHVDHAGLAETVRARSGCTVAGHATVALRLHDLPTTCASDDEWVRALLTVHGAPAEVIRSVGEISAAARHLCQSVHVDRPLVDGDSVDTGEGRLRVLFRPGHGRCDTIFVSEDGWAIVGDHILDGGTIAMAERPLEQGADPLHYPSAVLALRDSYVKTEGIGLDIAFPGHGAKLTDVKGAITSAFASQERRSERLYDHLADGPHTVWELVEHRRGTWNGGDPRHAVSQAFIHVSENLAHLDLLVDEGSAKAVAHGDGLIAYERR